jgi:hypothetical protein
VTLKLHKIECRAVVGHYDERGELVNEEISELVQSIYQVEQFEEFWKQLRLEVEQRNAAELEQQQPEAPPPNRAARRSSSRRRK